MQNTEGYTKLSNVARHKAIVKAMNEGFTIKKFIPPKKSRYAQSIGSMAIIANENMAMFV